MALCGYNKVELSDDTAPQPCCLNPPPPLFRRRVLAERPETDPDQHFLMVPRNDPILFQAR